MLILILLLFTLIYLIISYLSIYQLHDVNSSFTFYHGTYVISLLGSMIFTFPSILVVTSCITMLGFKYRNYSI